MHVAILLCSPVIRVAYGPLTQSCHARASPVFTFWKLIVSAVIGVRVCEAQRHGGLRGGLAEIEVCIHRLHLILLCFIGFIAPAPPCCVLLGLAHTLRVRLASAVEAALLV